MEDVSDPEIEALRQLIESTPGGRKAVAARIHANEQTLYQILSGVTLASGRPRSVGRDLRDRLDREFPDWRTLNLNEPAASYGDPAIDVVRLSRSLPPQRPDAHHVVHDLAALLDELSDAQRELAAQRLTTLAMAPDSAKARESLVALLDTRTRGTTGA